MPSRSLFASVLFCVACSGHVQSTAIVPMPAFAVSAQIATDQIPAPFSLTATDGSGLQLTRVDAKAVFEGPLAFTELHLWFHNTEDRVREGTFAITLPSRAAVSRFAMENNGQWMEAEVVEKLLARRAYEDFLHRRQDPALLEKADGNQFTARVFPIPAKGDKHIVISFSQDLPGERYTLPLRGLPKIDSVDVRMSMLGSDGRKTEQLLTEKNWQPDRDFVSTAPVGAEAVAAGPVFAAQVPVLDAAGAVADAPTAMTILVDTSASRTLGFAATAAKLDKMIGELRSKHGDKLELQVVAFDQETQLLFSGTAKEWGAAQQKKLLERGAAGASDLGQAIAWLGTNSPKARLVLFGDGVITAGKKMEDVATAIKGMRGIERFDVVLSGGIRDEAAATKLVRAATRAGAVLDLDTGAEGVVAALGERMLTDVPIAVKGATWVYPKSIPSVRAGTRVTVYARMPAAVQAAELSVNNQTHKVGLVAATKPLVERAAAAAEIAELDDRLARAEGTNVAELKGTIVRKSIAARVVSSQTSLLVLESDEDYVRYGIDRRALADIMEVGANGIVMRNRANPKLQIAEPIANKPPVQDLQKQPAKIEIADKSPPKDTGVEDFDGADDGDVMKKELAKAPAAPRPGNAGSGAAVRPNPEPAPVTAPPPPPPPRSPAPDARRRVADEADDDDRPARSSRRRPAAFVASEDEGDAEDSGGEREEREQWPPKNKPAALVGELAAIMKAIEKKDLNNALVQARAWHEREPGNVLAWIGLGEALEARKDVSAAARAYGSIIDLFPGRADLRRWAGERLERIGAGARELAIDTYRKAVADRPDHMTGHRLLAYALLRAGKHADAFAAILAGIEQQYPDGRFAGGDRILREDAGLIAASYAAAVPAKRNEITAALAKRGLQMATSASTRFVLYWETDANDVDFHIQDAKGGHAFYSSQHLPSGGDLYADVTTGYGPECFTIPGTPKAGPYRLSIDYYSQGPMGYGMGLLQVVRHDGKGKLSFEDRPYIIMADHAYVDLGKFQ